MFSILFVCTANLCRSPVAERLFSKAVKLTYPNHTWQVYSAGVWADRGRGSPSRLVKAATTKGLDLHPHRSQNVEQLDLATIDVILTMEAGQCEALRAEFPKLALRIYQLSALAGPRYDIADPYGGSEQEYSYMIDELSLLINKALPRIVEMAEKVHEETTQTMAPATKPSDSVNNSRHSNSVRADRTHRPIFEPSLSGS
ncbi:MAG: hypothetical protein U0175_19145 [Caldilineaceae bacterium]